MEVTCRLVVFVAIFFFKKKQIFLESNHRQLPKYFQGGWNDLCLLLNPYWGKDDNYMTVDRHRSQFSMHCVMGANMLMTGNLSALDPVVLETWGNPEAVGVNQDPLTKPYIQLTPANASEFYGMEYANDNDKKLFATSTAAVVQECGGEPSEQSWAFDTPRTSFLYNAFTNSCLVAPTCKGALAFDVCVTNPSGGPSCAEASLEYEQWSYDLAQQRLRSLLPNPGQGKPPLCATVSPDNSVVLEDCATDNTDLNDNRAHAQVFSNQTWTVDSATGQIRTTDGLCLTAPAPQPAVNNTLIVGHEVQGGWAVVFLNNNPTAQTISCGAQCFAAMGFLQSQKLTVRDLWLHQDLQTISATRYDVAVGPAGASRFLKFLPL